MRILVLSKRQYTGKDLLDDRYGRLYEIPASLAVRGHTVVGVALSYRQRIKGWYQDDQDHLEQEGAGSPLPDQGSLAWLGLNMFPWGIWCYPRQLARIAVDFQPDVVWACSDVFHAIVGALFSKVTGIPLVIDLYDDFESFAATKLPGIASTFRIACRQASGLTIVSQTLLNHVADHYGLQVPMKVVRNGIRSDLFYPRDRVIARTSLGLPISARLIGTAGAIKADRDINVLFQAFLQLAAKDPNLYLIFAGPRDNTPIAYSHPRIIDLGTLAYTYIPDFFSALDVAVICNRNSAFGQHCFPQKLFEILAVKTPVVAARLGDTARLLTHNQWSTYEPGNTEDLARIIRWNLDFKSTTSNIDVPSWSQLSQSVEEVFTEIKSKGHPKPKKT